MHEFVTKNASRGKDQSEAHMTIVREFVTISLISNFNLPTKLTQCSLTLSPLQIDQRVANHLDVELQFYH